MDMNINGIYGRGLKQAAGSKQHIDQSDNGAGKAGFGEVLRQRAQGSLSFSKHAAMRMRERGIDIDVKLGRELEHAIEGARKKGAKDVAVIGSQDVFIVNVPNNVVVTIMSRSDMKEKIFTNIDSAVLI